MVVIDGSIYVQGGFGWRNRCGKIHATATCWLEELSVGLADGIGIGFPVEKLIAIGDKAGIRR